MKWRKVDPEQSNWKRQIDIVEYYSGRKIGSIVYDDTGWNYVIDDILNFLNAETEEEAKKEMIDRLYEHFEEKIDHYRELIDGLEKLNP